MNRTLKEANVNTITAHMMMSSSFAQAFLIAYNFVKRLKVL